MSPVDLSAIEITDHVCRRAAESECAAVGVGESRDLGCDAGEALRERGELLVHESGPTPMPWRNTTCCVSIHLAYPGIITTLCIALRSKRTYHRPRSSPSAPTLVSAALDFGIHIYKIYARMLRPGP